MSSSTAANEAALRAILLARAAANSKIATNMSRANVASAQDLATEAIGGNNNNNTKAGPPAPPQPPAEDAVQDGGDAIDTFSSYVPTALPPCIVKFLHERAAASKTKSTNNDVVDLSNDEKKEDDANSIIEILDTDNEDSRLGMEDITNTALKQLQWGEGNIMDKKLPPSSITNNDTDNEESIAKNTTHSLFTSGKISSHTSPAVESALLSSVSAPSVPDESATTILPLLRDGKLSPLQAEGVSLAINRFNRVFTRKGSGKNDGMMRAGFFIGDGAGIGKGRQISATVLDALSRNHGKGRHLWISVSRELVQDARRDLSDVGCHVSVHDGAEVLDQMQGGKKGKGLGAGGSLGKGVLFITYSLLVSGKRMEDIIGWLSGSSSATSSKGIEERTRIEQLYSGVIVFDEAHKAKNLETDTRTARLVIAIQDRLPNARVLYCSATGVSDIKHMVYATRLGLWGPNANPLYPTFDSFHGALSKRGVGAMEMLALEMKRKGIFLARTLSWDGAHFHTTEVKLSEDQISTYDGAVRWWFGVKDQIDAALELMGISAPKMLWRTYWSAHQRFFREMCICAKIYEVTTQAIKYLENGDHAIVIGLQSTGEAGMETALEELAVSAAEDAGRKIPDFEDMTLSGLVSTSASIMTNFVRNHFPVSLPPPDIPKVPDMPPNGFANEAERLEHVRLHDMVDRMKNEPPPEPIPELVQRRHVLLGSIHELGLPPNPLDEIIDRLGGVDNVAEMTGRSGRILRNKSGKYKYVKRFGASKKKSYGLSMPVSSEESDRLNIVEKRKFMEGKKSVAIISDAASTGISLHADRRCSSSHKRRVHFTIELPWAADKAIQQLGRSHRSGQVTAPIYKMVVTELGGERRFASAVSKRMAQLGALTKGDRRAATGGDLSEFDIDSTFGRRALVRTYNALGEQPITAPSRNSNDILDKFVAASTISESPEEAALQTEDNDDDEKRAFALGEAAKALLEVGLMTGEPNVKKFLNRIAGLDVARQNLVFNLFMSTLDDVITDAKATGEFEGSVEDIRATSVTLKGLPEVIATDASCGAKTELTRLILDRGVSFNMMVQSIIDEDDGEGSDKSTTDVSNNIDNDEEDEEEEDDELVEDHCKAGFYMSKRKIAGRHLICYAARKAEEEVGIDADFIDPLRLMIISRPNTGKNPCEMPSEEMRYKYKLLVSSEQILKHLQSAKNGDPMSDEDGEEKSEKDMPQPQDAMSIVRSKWSKVADLWDDAYDNSNFKDHNDGLAPRISEIGLITGAVLHILPSLEKAVQFMPQSQRSLRVMRVELSDTGQRIVGIKFPVSDEAIKRLMTGMKEVANARQGSLDSPSFVDEPFSQIDEKARTWATTEKKTMKSFFAVASKAPAKSTDSSSSGQGKRKVSSDSATSSSVSSEKKQKPNMSTKKESVKKKKKGTANISSFFSKKNSY